MRWSKRWLWLWLACGLVSWTARGEETNKPSFFLPANPVAAAYVLGRLSNPELAQAPRSEFVYVALLQRAGLEAKYRLEALDGLSRLRQTDPLTELVKALVLLDSKGEASEQSVKELGPFLLRYSTSDLGSRRMELQKLAFESKLARTRQLGFSALISADRSIDTLWPQTTNELRADLLFAIPMVREGSVRGAGYAKVAPLVRSATSPEIQRGAIFAIVSIPGHDLETFNMLADLLEAGTERTSVIPSLLTIPREAWPKSRMARLGKSMLDFLQGVPAGEQTEDSYTQAIQFTSEVAALMAPEQSKELARILRGLGPAVFVIKTVYEQMRYDRQLIVVEAGKPVAITLENLDAMPHNLAIVMPGALEEVGLLSEKMSSEPDAQGRLYIPASPKVLFATKLVAPSQKTQLAFKAPSELGEYPYVCTFPGHWRRMVGVLAVVSDVDAYLAKAAASGEIKTTDWKLGDLTPDLDKLAAGRNLAAGKETFTKLACIQCHKLGSQGYAYGPDLTDVLKKYKDDHATLLLQILEPSKVVEERYKTFEFETKDGESLQGMILAEDAQTITVQSGPSPSLIQTLKKADIQNRRALNSTPMPLGLLNSLSKDQILDLLAFVESGGEAVVHDHNH